jgi:hypothetical protein
LPYLGFFFVPSRKDAAAFIEADSSFFGKSYFFASTRDVIVEALSVLTCIVSSRFSTEIQRKKAILNNYKKNNKAKGSSYL